MNGPSSSFPVAPPATGDSTVICHRLAGYDFPWELSRSLELAVLKTFCVPRISQLLRQTGEFEHRTQKRYDDTTLIFGNILKWGYDSPQGSAAIKRMNRIHERFDIPNEDFLYVLSTVIYEPIRWNHRFGWRLFTQAEKQALFEFWRAVGERMGLQQIPSTYVAFLNFNQTYEACYFAYHSSNAVISDVVLQLMQTWFPKILHPFVPTVVKVLVDEPMRAALGWRPPHPLIVYGIVNALQLRRRIVRHFPRRRRSQFVVDRSNPTYPTGYDIEQLGPQSAPRTSSKCPFMRMKSLL
ncbi:MAG: oxygenase MpaB family protein [Leptolyngbyaceae cyanobacterium]